MAFTRALLLGFVLLAAGLVRSGWAANPGDNIPVAQAVPITPDRDRPIGPGDTVSLEIVEDKAPPILKRISDTGDLDVPNLGRVHAAGRTCADVAAQIKRQLEASLYYKATVKLAIEQISAKRAGIAGKVFISGEVKLTSPQELTPGETLTVSGAVVKAGGGTPFADLKNVKLTRKNKGGSGSTSFIINVRAVLEKGEMDKDRELMDGDYIFVPRKIINFQ